MTTLEQLMTDLKAAGANENTLRLAMNCYELGYERGASQQRFVLAEDFEKMPFGDTAASFAAYVRNWGQK